MTVTGDEVCSGRTPRASGFGVLSGLDAGTRGILISVFPVVIYRAVGSAETVSAATLRRTKAVAPVYPRRALQRNITGRVKVEFTVGVDGRTREIEVVESNQGGLFDRSALRAISEWEYEPRVVRGQPVAQRVDAYLDYNLE